MLGLVSFFSKSILIDRKKWMKGSQTAICMSPGFCITPMTEKFPKGLFPQMNNTYSSYSGAFRIFESAMNEKATAEVFYHRGRESNY